jgi:flagellar basal-body rod protein FlgB
MGFDDLPLVGMLKSRMRFLEARQKVLAENVANAETPGFRARDLREPSFREMVAAGGGGAGGVRVATTSPMHLAGGGAGDAGFGSRRAETFETTPDRNSVVLEDEMMKVAETQQDYQLVSMLYTKSLSLLKLAVQRR